MKQSSHSQAIDILIVDDDDVDRERLCRMLAASPLQANTKKVSTGLAAIEALRETSFDCMLLDYHLGDGVGMDVVSRISEESELFCPVILVTGMGNEQVAVQAMREGVYDYLSKHDLNPDKLCTTIESVLRRAELERELEQSQERLRWLGLYDSLTGLPNRNLFFDRLEQASHAVSRGNSSFGLLMIDLDLFKEVNDTLGHDAGDQVLAEIGRRLQRTARVSDSFARLGGDEFGGILMGTKTAAGACTAAQGLCEAIRAPICVKDRIVTVGASIGIAVAPLHGRNGQDLLAQADMAMYAAKRGSRGYEVATANQQVARETSPVIVANQIAEAIERSELFLHFQPKVDLASGSLSGVEALVRWNRPGVGLVPPGQFIAPVERTSMIGPMTFAILDMALDQVTLWRDQGWEIPTSVNFSARMLDDQSLVRRIADALEQRDLPPRLLTMEVTETSLMSDPKRAKRVLDELARAGIAISIDDFGSGFSSLMYLRELDISEIKLDKAFVDGLKTQGRDASIVRSVATLSQGFEIELVAEGIEDRNSVPLLKELGCDIGQGFSIARPMPANDFAGWWSDWQSTAQASFAA